MTRVPRVTSGIHPHPHEHKLRCHLCGAPEVRRSGDDMELSTSVHGFHETAEIGNGYDLERQLAIAERRYAEARGATDKARAEWRALATQAGVSAMQLGPRRRSLKRLRRAARSCAISSSRSRNASEG